MSENDSSSATGAVLDPAAVALEIERIAELAEQITKRCDALFGQQVVDAEHGSTIYELGGVLGGLGMSMMLCPIARSASKERGKTP